MEITFLEMASVSEKAEITNHEIRTLRQVIKGFTYFSKGDVILAKITPCMQNGKAAYIDDRIPTDIGFGSTEFHVIRPSEKINGKFLFHLLWSDKFRYIAEKNMTGTAGQKRVPAQFVSRYKFELPLLEEQIKIATTLDKMLEGRDNAKSLRIRYEDA